MHQSHTAIFSFPRYAGVSTIRYVPVGDNCFPANTQWPILPHAP